MKAVVQDASSLFRAELELAKAELAQAVKVKVLGAAMLIVAAVLGWLGVQALLITIGVALAIVLPAWAAALIVTALLLIAAAIAGLLGKNRLAAHMGMEATKTNVEEDLAWTKAHLPNK